MLCCLNSTLDKQKNNPIGYYKVTEIENRNKGKQNQTGFHGYPVKGFTCRVSLIHSLTPSE